VTSAAGYAFNPLMPFHFRPVRTVFLSTLAALLLHPVAAARAAEAAPVTIAGPAGARVRVEALDPHIVRIWYKPAGAFVRETSLAMQTAPTGRVPLVRREEGDTIELATEAVTVRFDRRTLRFEVVETGGARVVAAVTVTPAEKGAWTLTHGLAPEEKLLGLGEDNQNYGRLDRRGTVRDLWAGQKIESGNVTAQYPIPLLLSTGRSGHAYGLFYDNVHHLNFDLGRTQADEVKLAADGGEIDLYVIDGPRLAEVIERYTGLTGRPSLPPLWALGYWQSRCTYYDWNQLDEAYRQLTARGFPVDAMVIDADWPEIVTNYRWAKRWTEAETGHGRTPAEKIADYARKGVKIVVSQSGPMVKQESPTFASGWAAGVFATDGKGNPVECGYYGGKLIDFTHPKLNDWLWPQTRRLVEQGIAGWWLDLDEPEGEPPQTHYFAGGPANIHNEYSLLCTRSFEEVQLAVHPDQRPFILSRCGPAGYQRFQGAVWTGDINSDYATLRAHPPEMLNSGLSGLAWWTCDTGGFLSGYYRNDQFGAHAALYGRWMQFSVFSPIVRAHKAGGAPEPYAFGPAAEQSNRHYLQLRYRLLPYIYSYAWEASQRGLPLVRPLALEYPDDAQAVATPGDEYLFGRELLVAPVLHEGQVNRTVYFPPGRWIDWDFGYEYAGGRTWVVAAPPNRIPVAVRAGAIIPLAPDMKNTAEKPWDPLMVEIFPDGRSSFALYRDDGATFAYTRGESTITRFACDAVERRVQFTLDEANKLFTPKRYVLHFHLDREPLTVAVDGAGAIAADGEWSWEAAARVLTVNVEAGESRHHAVELRLAEAALPGRLAPVLEASPIDPKGEALGSAGTAQPHIFPPPALPARYKAINYDNGGEGVAFHRTRPTPDKTLYRPDDLGIAETNDAGGGHVLKDLTVGEWARYTIDCGQGGAFDLVVRSASAAGGGRFRLVEQDRTVATVEVPATGGADAFKDIAIPGVYLNPGEQGLLLLVEAPGFALNTIEFRPAAKLPTVYPAEIAARAGVVELSPTNGDDGVKAVLTKLGRIDSSATFGVMVAKAGPATLRYVYQNATGKTLPFTLRVGDGAETKLSIPPTGNAWQNLDLPVTLRAGGNRVTLAGQVDGWDAISLRALEVIAR